MADLSTSMKGVLYINHRNAGWSETYYLKTNSYADGLSALALLAAYRRSFMATGTEMVWARVSFIGNPKEAKGLGGLPLKPLPQVGANETLDNPFDALHYRFETATGKSGNKLLRGVPDSLVADFKFNGIMPEPLDPAEALSNPNDPAGSLSRIQRSFLRWLISNTQRVQITDKGPPAQGIAEAWDRCIPRKISNRKTGRPFGMFRGRAASHTP